MYVTQAASIFARAVVPQRSRQARCNVLNEMTRNIKHILSLQLSQIHEEKGLALAQKYIKMDFQKVLLMDEARANLDGQDEWAKVWNPNGTPTPYRFSLQQEGGGIMI